MIVALYVRDDVKQLPQETGMSRRRLYYLLEVGQFIERWGICEAAAANVGWTKLQIISRHAGNDESKSAKDIEAYLEAASVTTAYALSTTLRQGRAVPKKAVVFRLNVGARAELREALAAFGAKSRGKGMILKEKALIKIVRTAMSIRA